jgi:hypothetical protein
MPPIRLRLDFTANVRLTRHSRAQQNRQQKTLTKDYLLQQAIEICRCRVLKNVVNAARHDAITIQLMGDDIAREATKISVNKLILLILSHSLG